MISMRMRNLVESSLSAHGPQTYFGDRMTELATAQGVSLSAGDIEGIAELGSRYVRETMRLLESCATAAGQAHAETVVKPVINQCEEFFLQPNPDLPDQEGLLGIICDAYLSREVIARISERTRVARGFPLIAADPHPEAGMIRSILGAELADRLDQEVETCTDGPQLRFICNSTYQLQNSLRATGRVGDWSDTLEDQLAQFAADTGLSFG